MFGGDDAGWSGASQSISSGSGISFMTGGDELKTLWAPARTEGEGVKLFSANDRFGVAILSSSSMVLYL